MFTEQHHKELIKLVSNYVSEHKDDKAPPFDYYGYFSEFINILSNYLEQDNNKFDTNSLRKFVSSGFI